MKVNLGSGKNYMEGYVNIDINPMWKPDIICDISEKDLTLIPYTLYCEVCSKGNIVKGGVGQVEEIIAHDVLEHISDLVSAMTNCLLILKEGYTMDISVPYYLSLGAWQDPTHVRAFNENSWLYYTEWFWYLGWKTHRFELVELTYVLSEYGAGIKVEGQHEVLVMPKAVDSMRVVLKKIALTDKEKKIAEEYYGIHKRSLQPTHTNMD